MLRSDRRSLVKAIGALAAFGALPRAVTAARADEAATSFTVEIAPGVYAHKGAVALPAAANVGDTSNMGFIVGREAVAVIDTGGSAKVGARLLAAARATTPLPIRYVINTHMHPDHVFGNVAFEAEKPTFVAHHKMARGLSARAERYMEANKEALGEDAFEGTKIVLPTLGISEATTLDLGGREIVLEPQPTAHTDNDLIVVDKQTNTAFLGDLLFAEHIPTLDGSILGWLRVLAALSQTPYARVVPGHGGPSLPWPDGAKPIQRYFDTIRDEIRALLADDKTLTEATERVGLSEKDAWELFPDYHVRNVSAAFAELEWE